MQKKLFLSLITEDFNNSLLRFQVSANKACHHCEENSHVLEYHEVLFYLCQAVME